jgi:hypothetical protein
MHTHSPNKLKKFKQRSARKLISADDRCFLGQERSADDGIHAIRDKNNITSVLRNAKKSA